MRDCEGGTDHSEELTMMSEELTTVTVRQVLREELTTVRDCEAGLREELTTVS